MTHRNSVGGTPSDTEEALSQQWKQCAQLKKNIDTILESFEGGNEKSISHQQTLGVLTNDLQRKANSITTLYENKNQDLTSNRRELWSRRIVKLKEDVINIRHSLDKQINYAFRRQIEEDERKQLLGASKHAQQYGDAQKAFAKERDVLEDCHNMIDSMRAQGRETVSSMVSQNKALKVVKRKMLDMASAVGLSSSLISLSERRHAVDRWLVYGCMIFTALLFGLLMYFFKYRRYYDE